jgi:hypothetical protein
MRSWGRGKGREARQSPRRDYALAGVFASTQMFIHPLEMGNGNKPAKNPGKAMRIVRDRPQANELAVHLRGDPQNRGEISIAMQELCERCSRDTE